MTYDQQISCRFGSSVPSVAVSRKDSRAVETTKIDSTTDVLPGGSGRVSQFSCLEILGDRLGFLQGYLSEECRSWGFFGMRAAMISEQHAYDACTHV